MNQLVAIEVRLTIQDKVEKALILLTVALKEGRISEEARNQLLEAHDHLHMASVLCKMQSGPTSTETEDKDAA